MHVRDMPTDKFPFGHHIIFNKEQADFLTDLADKNKTTISKLIRKLVADNMQAIIEQDIDYGRG